MQEMCGPQCWHGIEADPGGFKKTMLYEVMKEFNSKAVSSWSSFSHTGPWDKWTDVTIGLHRGANDGYVCNVFAQ